MRANSLNIFLVDDDAAARLTATFPFEDPRYQITEFDNGQAFLDAIDGNPDIVLLDIEMPGMSGIETCRALRDSLNWPGHVIFVSSHNDMETRMRAYDAGGSDYIVKPFNAEELLQKVKVAEEILNAKRGLEAQVALASSTAFTAMSSMGELGTVMQFLRASFTCTTCEQLARELFNALQQYGLDGLVELQLPGQTHAVSSQGPCTPLEHSILSHGRSMDHLFQFRDRIVLNYPGITLVVSRLPIADPDTVGRLRDHLSILAEGASARLSALASESARRAQGSGIHEALSALSAILSSTEQQQAAYRLKALDTIDQYIVELESSFVHLELSQKQEETLSRMARGMADRLGGQLGDSREISDQLHGVVGRLQQLAA